MSIPSCRYVIRSGLLVKAANRATCDDALDIVHVWHSDRVGHGQVWNSDWVRYGHVWHSGRGRYGAGLRHIDIKSTTHHVKIQLQLEWNSWIRTANYHSLALMFFSPCLKHQQKINVYFAADSATTMGRAAIRLLIKWVRRGEMTQTTKTAVPDYSPF